MQDAVDYPLPLIQKGSLQYQNLMKLRKSEPWLRETLSQLQIYDMRDVRYAMLDEFGDIHVLYA